MLFYRMEFIPHTALEKRSTEQIELICRDTGCYNADYPKDTAFYISSERTDAVIACAAVLMVNKPDVSTAFGEFMAHLGYTGRIESICEVTLQFFRQMLMVAEHFGFIGDTEDELVRLNLDGLSRARISRDAAEDIIRNPLDREHAIRLAKEGLVTCGLLPELDRIYAGSPAAFHGYPVHYMITCSNAEAEQSILDILLGALLQAGRLPGRRYCTFKGIGSTLDNDVIEALYSALSGGTAVLKLTGDDSEEEFASDTRLEAALKAASIALRHHRSVLTIVCVDNHNEVLTKRIEEAFASVALVKLTEDVVSFDKAAAYLNGKARADGLTDTRGLRDMLETATCYTRTELDAQYDHWYDVSMRTTVYSQYAEVRVEQKQRLVTPVGSAMEELDCMTGLAQAKRTIHEIIDYSKAQKLLFDKGFTQTSPALHMVFSGNPGTAKTTVARLLARIMRDNGILSDGKLIEVGRADLVGKYVGWTARIVKEKFKLARGSVLFIDEAYSLVEERGLYGDEAINTIVQEMENARENTVVIFAGYPDKMAEFIERNPGFKSRVAFYVDFPDYSVDELMDIFRFNMKKANLTASESAEQAVREQLAEASQTPDFGNGRYVRNLIEQATLKQASRLIRMDTDRLSPASARMLLAEDFQHLKTEQKPAVRKIGF